MTAVFYRDIHAVSPNSTFKVTAKSPFNGEILDREGKDPRNPLTDIHWPCHQKDFRYQLLDRNGHVVWERWLPGEEGSPHELLVSDDGIVVIRAHGYRFRPEIIVVFADGDTARISILSESESKRQQQTADGLPQFVVEVMHETSAGCFWADHSWPYFVNQVDRSLFVWRTLTGQRIILDLTTRLWITPDSIHFDEIKKLLDDIEAIKACELLENLANQKSQLLEVFRNRVSNQELEVRLGEQLRRVIAAVLIVTQQKLRKAEPFLLALEELDCTTVFFSTAAIGFFTRIQRQDLRLIIQNALRSMDQTPNGFSPFFVLRKGKRYLHTDTQRMALRSIPQEHLSRASKLHFLSRPKRVLASLGMPDEIEYEVGMRWKESWDYDYRIDGKWRRVRIHWKPFAWFWARLASVEIVEPSFDDFEKRVLGIATGYLLL